MTQHEQLQLRFVRLTGPSPNVSGGRGKLGSGQSYTRTVSCLVCLRFTQGWVVVTVRKARC